MADERKAALVTGGARRVGRAVALRLAEGGYDVAITYLSSRREAEEVVGAIRQRGRVGVAIGADLAMPAEAVETIRREVSAALGRLDVLVNNASLYEAGDDVAKMMAIHVEGPLLLCRRFGEALRENGGHVVNMVDVMAERPVAKYAAYCASKAALGNLTLSLAREMAPEVTVNGIAPGVVEWPAGMAEAERKKYLERVPLGRAGSPADVAELVYFLVTKGTYITGQIIRLDGGRSIVP